MSVFKKKKTDITTKASFCKAFILLEQNADRKRIKKPNILNVIYILKP